MIRIGALSNQQNSEEREIERVGVAGSGVMGTQLTAYFLSRNLQVTLFTRNPRQAKILLNKFLTKRYPYLENISDSDQLIISSDIKVLSETQIVIETIKEDLIMKKELIKKILETNSSVIIGSCTSSLTLKQISSGLEDKGRIQIIHFSNPVAKLKVIELVLSKSASDETRTQLGDFFSQLEHKVIEVPDVPGYVINTIMFAMIEKANFLAREYGISRENIDDLMKLGCGFPMGPFEIEKLVGSQTVDSIKKNLATDI